MTLVLDSGGLTMLATSRARLAELRARDERPAIVPSVVLAETLTGDHRRDFAENRLLRTCDIRRVDERLARRAAALRTAVTHRDDVPSAVDAIVVALAESLGAATVVTNDPVDVQALAQHAHTAVRIVGG